MEVWFIMPHPLIGGAIKRCFCLTSVCRVHGPKSRTERHRKTKIGTETAHVTRDLDTTFKVKGQGHQAALFSTALTVMRLQWSAWKRIRRGKVLLRCVCSVASDGRRGAGAYCVARAQLVSCMEWKRFQILHLIVPAKPIRNQFWFHAPIGCVLSMSGVVTVYWYSLYGGTICCWPCSLILPWLQYKPFTYLLTYLSLLQMGMDIWLYHASKLVYWSCTESFDIFRSFKLLVFLDDDEWCCYAVVKVRGLGGLSPCSHLSPPAIVWAPNWFYA